MYPEIKIAKKLAFQLLYMVSLESYCIQKAAKNKRHLHGNNIQGYEVTSCRLLLECSTRYIKMRSCTSIATVEEKNMCMFMRVGLCMKNDF